MPDNGLMPKKSIKTNGGKRAKRSKEFEQLEKMLRATEPEKAVDRREVGLDLIQEIVGDQGGAVLNQLTETSPELARFIVDFAYGDVISRKGLDPRTRALVVVATLAALGHAHPQLKVHLGSALRSGCSQEEIIETLLLVTVYAGFPAGLNGMTAVQEVFAKNKRR